MATTWPIYYSRKARNSFHCVQMTGKCLDDRSKEFWLLFYLMLCVWV